jgi:hypothetical protein
MLAQKVLGKSRDLLAFQDAVLRDPTFSGLQSNVGWRVPADGARRDNENVAGQLVPGIDRNNKGRPLLASPFPGDGHPIEATPKRPRIQLQVFPI